MLDRLSVCLGCELGREWQEEGGAATDADTLAVLGTSYYKSPGCQPALMGSIS